MITAAERVLETERKRFERVLHEKDAQLERADHMKADFLAMMSHELRTPLATVIGFSAALRDGLVGPLTDNQRGFSSEIFASGHHLLALIDDMLDLSNAAAGTMTLQLEEVELGLLLEDALSTARELASGTGTSFELHTAPDLEPVVLDRGKVVKIAGHLLANAATFGAGGTVVVTVRRVPRDAVGTLPGEPAVHAVPLPGSDFLEFVQISVTDHGIGISPEDLSTMFQPFSQVDGGIGRAFDGTGHGLALIRQLTAVLGGTVAVAGAEGDGARFVVWLPIRRPNHPGCS